MRKLRGLIEVELGEAPVARFRPLVDDDMWKQVTGTMSRLATAMRGRRVWNVNSTARGGGVAEMLAAIIPYSRGCQVDERWVVIEGSPEFFEVTKTLHNFLHGVRPQGVALTDHDRRCYEESTAQSAAALLDQAAPGDVAILQDPQTAGLAPALRQRGLRVVWRSHIGVDSPNDAAREGWDFLRPFVQSADAVVFSRRAYVWEGLEGLRVEIIPPCIDPFAAKNRDLEEQEIERVLREARIDLPERFVLQVSRWDRLKDPVGVMEVFAQHVAPRVDANLVLAGPATTSVKDDPEQPEVLDEVARLRASLPEPVRERTLIAQLPMEDVEKNALMVNALQRRADVVVQKSLAEGFGLTVAEAMWKAKPVVASHVGGIGDQIEDGKSGLLISDPHDSAGFGNAIVGVLNDQGQAAALGAEARRRVGRWYITPRHLLAQGTLLGELVSH